MNTDRPEAVGRLFSAAAALHSAANELRQAAGAIPLQSTQPVREWPKGSLAVTYPMTANQRATFRLELHGQMVGTVYLSPTSGHQVAMTMKASDMRNVAGWLLAGADELGRME